MDDAKRRCIGCMREIENVRVCPYCGYDDETPISKDYLTPRYLLQDRYVIGKPLRYNGEGVTYIAFDLIIDDIVEVREYFPDKLSKRVEDSESLAINQGFEAEYKALLIDFMELNQSLAKMRTLTSLEQTYEIFEENNTAYAIKEHVEGITFAQYLSENAGELSWEKTFALFEPLLKNISAMHAHQILHRGISPDTIRVIRREELKLSDFCISSARNVKTEISAQVFMGYAAPEQFSSSVYQGTWTDVYAICAVLYRALTGSRPPEFNNRGRIAEIIPPSVLNSTVPQAVSTAILQGLSQLTEDRTKTVGVLLSELSAFEKKPEVNVEEPEPPQEEKPKRYGLLALLITGGVLVVVGAVIVILTLTNINHGDNNSTPSDDSSGSSSSSSSSSEESSSGSSSSSDSSISGVTYVMPTLVGQYYDSVMSNENYKTMMTVEVSENVYHDTVPKGVIIEQDVEPNELIPEGMVVKVVVSKGKRMQAVPEYSGLNKDQYTALLTERGLSYNLIVEDNSDVASGQVFAVNPSPGTTIDIESGTKIEVHVAK